MARLVSAMAHDWSTDKAIFIEGCINQDSQYEFSFRKTALLAGCLLLQLLCSIRYVVKGDSLAFVSNKLTNDILGDRSFVVSHGRAASSLSAVRSRSTLIGCVSRMAGIRLLIRCLRRWPADVRKYGFVRWYEFWLFEELLDAFFGQSARGLIECASTTDRYVTWMSGITREHGGSLRIYLHGSILGFGELPCHMHVAEFGVYNKREEDAARRKLVANSDCRYFPFPFVSHVSFKELEKDDGYTYVGVVSNGNPDFDIRASLAMLELVAPCKVLIMLHPNRDADKAYKRLCADHRDVSVSRDEKYSNFDYLVMTNSTMVYDYYVSGFLPKVINISEQDLFGFLSDSIFNYSSFDELIEAGTLP